MTLSTRPIFPLPQTPPGIFFHERLAAYHLAIDFVALAHECAAPGNRGGSSWTDLQHAATTLARTIAQSASQTAAAEKRRILARAMDAVADCAVLLDVCRRVYPTGAPQTESGKLILEGIVGILTAMTKTLELGPLDNSRRPQGNG